MRSDTKDVLYGALNGAIFGFMAPYVLKSFDISVNRWLFILLFGTLGAFGIYIGLIMRRFLPVLFQIAKFGIVGVANTAIDFGVFNFLLLLTGIHSGTEIIFFKTASFSAAVINSYFWNKYWSFNLSHTTQKDPYKEFMQFFAVSIIGAFLNITTTFIFTNWISPFGIIPKEAWPNVGAAVGAILVLAWNFLGYKFFVFKNPSATTLTR